MKMLAVKIIFLVLFIQSAFAQITDTVYIDCPGIVGGTWNNEIRYIARCNVVLPYDSVLSIEAGTHIEFEDGYNFKVEGQLTAVGSANDRIQFSPYGSYWKGISFSTPSGETWVRTSQLAFADLDCGNASGTVEAVVVGKHIVSSLNNLHISNAGKAVKITGAAQIDNIRNCEFTSLAQAVNFQYCDLVSDILIENCIFSGITDRAVVISQNQAFLDHIKISGSSFNNSTLQDNLSESAVYISLNNKLTGIDLISNNFTAFSRNTGADACIFINSNAILDVITMSGNTISSCGGATPTQPAADFGGLYINRSNSVIMNGNAISSNTGRKSGAGYIRAGMISGENNDYLSNRNNYTDNENFGGALTLVPGSRIEFTGDFFENNFSAKSGGAFYIQAESLSSPVDLLFNSITLNGNNASNEGGAALIYADMDSLYLTTSEVHWNYSAAGSGGCLSIITGAFQDLTISGNSIQDNYVSETSFGGLIYLRHDPSMIPEYGHVTLTGNTISVAGHDPARNYSILYSKVKSFPASISIVDEVVTNNYPVTGNLYHYELLTGDPAPSMQDVELTMNGNSFEGNRCPIMYFSNDFVNISADFAGNEVTGDGGNYGTFLTINCQKAADMQFEDEQYTSLISGTSGGAVSVTTVKETGNIHILSGVFHDCFAVDGNGGHFSFVSEGSDAASTQSLRIENSLFSNSGISQVTGEDGGAIYVKTPGSIDSVVILSSTFESLGTGSSGGAIFVDAKDIARATISGSTFEDILTQEGDGAICLYAGDGNIPLLEIIPENEVPTTFTGCISGLDGGALSARASREIGTVKLIEAGVTESAASSGNGGHFSLVSQSNNPDLSQNLHILNCSLEGGLGSPYGGKGGSVFYSTPGVLDSLILMENSLTDFNTSLDGGAVCLIAKEIHVITLEDNVIDGAYSVNGSGGALNIRASDGNIGLITDKGNVISDCHAKSDGGFASFTASGEIGRVVIDSVQSAKCYAAEGNGGHLALISGSNNSGLTQQLLISSSLFSNAGIGSSTGQDGGAIYFSTPGDLDSMDVRLSRFEGLKAGGNAGALCLVTRKTNVINLLGTVFSQNTSLDTAGAVYLRAGGGNLGKIRIAPLNGLSTEFIAASSQSGGGALFAKASGEVGTVMIDTTSFLNCYSANGNGGHLSLVSLGADASQTQELIIQNSSFSNEGIGNITGKQGGSIYYTTISGLATLDIRNSSFSDLGAAENGGAIFADAGSIAGLHFNRNLFSNLASQIQSGGAIYLHSLNGIPEGQFIRNRFIDCSAGNLGGSICISDEQFENLPETITWTGNFYRKVNETAMPSYGGAVYCKGITAVHFVSDSSVTQSAGLQGGFVYLEKVYRASYDSLYAYGNAAGKGGVVYHNGEDPASPVQSSGIFNSALLFNIAGESGGCLYLTGVDSVEIGAPEAKNTFVANQSMSVQNTDLTGGGALSVLNAGRVDIRNNSFYVNKAKNNGGIGVFSNISDSLRIENNNFLSNQAKAGGAFMFVGAYNGGLVAGNNFSTNASSEQGGALLFSPGTESRFLIRDNTFFKNSTGKIGGAVATYRPVVMKRNLFRENHLSDINPGQPHKGTTIYAGGAGSQSVFKNCVFDQNYYMTQPSVASVYFDGATNGFPPFSIANCSFFNFNDTHYAVYNSSENDTVHIQNSIFTLRQNIRRDGGVVYFNATVKSHYSDLIYSLINDPVDHNYDEYIYFNIGDYYFDSTQYPVDMGNPAPEFHDFHLPPAYGTLRNDLGISGGPDNPDTNGIFLFHEPVDLPTNFDVVVVSHQCYTYQFECRGPFVENYEFFYWFMPDTIITTDGPALEYTFTPPISGNVNITALGHDLNNADVYGYGQDTINLDIIRIYSVTTGYENNTVDVPSVPFSMSVQADVYVENNTAYTSDWVVTESAGTEYLLQKFTTSCNLEVQKITSIPAFIRLRYVLEACGKTLDSVITINLQPSELWGCPTALFTPSFEGVIDTTSTFTIDLDRILLKPGGQPLENTDLDTYLLISRPTCPGIAFRKTVTYTPTRTIFRIQQYNETTQLPDTLCNGEYVFTLKTSELVTQFYSLNCEDVSKSYTVCCNDISEQPSGAQVRAYPNPVKDQLHLDFGNDDDYLVMITDVRGTVQKSESFAGVREVNLNLEPLSDGIYILKVMNTTGSQSFYLKINKITH